MPIEDIKNYIAVTDNLGTGGQPSEQQVRDIAEAKFEVVVNLGLTGQPYSLPDEAGQVRSLGLDYRHIPVDFKAPQQENFTEFLGAMDEAVGKRVFVHCAANYRVACFVGLYAQARLGWSRGRADDHIAKIWQPDGVWSAFLEEARRDMAPAE
jgi:protein tyrosine phosphatase (PTP) superfamily phosphohydrolase (DUF442 family)